MILKLFDWKFIAVTSFHFRALSSLYRRILALRASILNQEFVVSEVRYIERIYKGLIRQGPEVLNIDMFVIPGVCCTEILQ